jgi:hypothetical protein
MVKYSNIKNVKNCAEVLGNNACNYDLPEISGLRLTWQQ